MKIKLLRLTSPAVIGVLVFSNLATAQWSSSPEINNPIIVRAGSNQITPVIARDGADGAMIVWVDTRFADSDIYGLRIDASGTLRSAAAGILLVGAGADQESPAIAEGDNGEFFLAWQDRRNQTSDNEIFAQRFTPEGEPLWFTDVLAQPFNNSPPLILRNESGIITSSYVSSLFDDFIAFQAIDDQGNDQFDPVGIVSTNALGLQPDLPPAVMTGLNGGLIAAWANRRVNTSIFAKGIQSDSTVWSAGEVLVSAINSTGSSPVIIADGNQGAIIVWLEPLGGPDNDAIKAMRLNANGAKVWNPEVRPIAAATGKKRNLKIAADGQNGGYLVWENVTDFSRVFVQRIFNDGQSWSTDRAVTVSSSNQTNAAVVENGRNEAIVTWEDDRDDNLDIYAQRFSAAGTRLWAEDGVAVSTASSDQKKPVLVDDGIGGAIIAWEDGRNSDSDIYAQRVSVTGVLGEFRTISVTSPIANDNWEIGGSQVIRWTASAEISNVKIELSRDGGQNFAILFASIPNSNPQDGRQDFDVSGGASNNCIIRVSAVEASFVLDQSDLFAISAPRGPELATSPVASANRRQAIEVTADVFDISGVAEVLLNYKLGGASNFASANMIASSSRQFRGTIPAEVVTERGVEYFVSARDDIEQSSRSDTFFVNVEFGRGVQTHAVINGTTQNAYRMVSSPNLLDEILADSIFAASAFGAYDTTSWRLFDFRNNSYVERDSLNANTFRFTLGKAYWLISARGRTIDFGSGNSLRSDLPATLLLASGWNQIADPFAFPISWDAILAANGNPGEVGRPNLYDGSYAVVDLLEPYKGYFVLNSGRQAIPLRINPVAVEGATSSLKPGVLTEADWKIQIDARCQDARDHFNFLGIHHQASQNWDRLDYPEPPPIGQYISVYFPRNDWEMYPNDYTTDYRSDLGEGQTWTFNVKSNIPGAEARLTFSGMETLPTDVQIWLLDEKLNIKQELQRDPVYILPAGSSGTNKALKLLIGSTDYLSNEISDLSLIPADFELSQNFPNPFNPVTSIRYGLPRTAKVQLKIYDLLGREVITLIDNKSEEAGFHLVNWNGQDKHGRAVASGLYIYRLAADEFVQTRKMVLVR